MWHDTRILTYALCNSKRQSVPNSPNSPAKRKKIKLPRSLSLITPAFAAKKYPLICSLEGKTRTAPLQALDPCSSQPRTGKREVKKAHRGLRMRIHALRSPAAFPVSSHTSTYCRRLTRNSFGSGYIRGNCLIAPWFVYAYFHRVCFMFFDL